MKMLQLQPPQSYTTTTNPFSVPTHSFINNTPKKSIFLPRVGPTFSPNLTCRQPELFQPKPFPPPQRPQPSSSSSSSVRELPLRVYVGRSVYKGKAVLTVSPVPPEFTSLDSGAFKISKEGLMLLQFAPSAGFRQYDWSRKQVFKLSVDEMGNLINLGARESCEFFHDPFMGRSDEGKVRKVLKVEPLHDGSGHMFKLSVQNKLKNIDENIFIPVTKAEFAVFNSLFNFIMPCLLGWNAFADSIKPEVNIANRRRREEDFEWNR